MRAKKFHAIASETICLPSYSEPLAKLEKVTGNFQTFYGHTIDSLIVLSHIVKRETRAINVLCRKFSLDRERFLRSLFLSTVFHDVGKLTEEFQASIRKGKHSQTRPHAFFSLPILNWLFKEYYMKTFLDPDLFIEICTILGHHTQLHTNMYQSVDKDAHYIKSDIANFLNSMNDVRAALEFGNEFNLEEITVEPQEIPGKIIPDDRSPLECQIKEFITNLMLRVSEYPAKERAKALYSVSLSMLKASDQMASRSFDKFAKAQEGHQVFGSILKDPSRFFEDLVIREDKLVPVGRSLYRYQNELFSTCPEYALVRAPCGRGKTDAAMLWAKACCNKYGCNRIVVAMPTQITSNAMRDTLAKFSSREQVGIFHGRSFLLLKQERVKLAQRSCEESDDLDAEDLEDVKAESYMGKVYHKPITVSTTDHLVYSLVHGYSQADYALGNLQRATLVFDEVHYYERQSLECLISLFKILRRMKIPHLIMSGTLPSFFVDKVNEESSYQVFDDAEGSNFTPFVFKTRYDECLIDNDCINEKVLDEIEENYRNGLRQFVILNTVTRSKRFYTKVKNRLGPSANIVLHHSQLAFSDRSKKEELILKNKETRPFILIATQIIEISLNISCDIMYTELAPADALGQRGGRLNRGGANYRTDSTEHTMHIFGVKSALPYDDELLTQTKQVLFDGPASYLGITKLCDKVYNSIRLYEHTPFRTLFSDSTLFGRPYWDISSEDDEGRPGFQFREENEHRMISVIPESLYKNREQNLTIENEVQIPLWKLIRHQDDATIFYQASRFAGRKEVDFWICKTPYNGEVGFVEDSIPESETFGSSII